MATNRGVFPVLPTGEQPAVERVSAETAVADTFAGRVHVEWDDAARVTPLGQLPFFIEYMKQGGLFDGWVSGCPLYFSSPNAPSKRDVLGTVLLSVLAGHWRYAHMTTLRCDPVNPPLLGMRKVVSEDAVRRGFDKIEEDAGLSWLQEHLDYCTRPLLGEPWILDVDTTVKPLYGHQEGAVVSYNPHKPGRPSHSYHCYMLANLRLILAVEVQAGNHHTSKHSAPGLWRLLDGLSPTERPTLLRGDAGWGNEPIMREAEQRGQPYLFKLRLTNGVKRAVERAMRTQDWHDAGAGWQGKKGELRLQGWSRQRRIVIMRQRTLGPPPQDHDATLPAPALQAQLALLALPTGAGIVPILRAHRSLDRTLDPIRQAQFEQIRLATLLRLPHDRLVAPTSVAAQQRGSFRRR